MKRIAWVVVALAMSAVSWAAGPWSGVWVLRNPTKGFRLTMTLEEVGDRWKISYRIPVPDGRGGGVSSVMTIDTALDGKEVPNLVDGKPSGQTMEIRKVDSHHTYTVIKFQGKQTAISKSELSADGKVIKTDNDFAVSSPDGTAGKQVQYWDKQ
ncbi:MAG: hypothetical protein ACXWCN_06685 [Caldimonas sp.]